MSSNPIHQQQNTHRAANSLRDIYFNNNHPFYTNVSIWTNLYSYRWKLQYSLVVLGACVGAGDNDNILLRNDYYIALYIYD